MNKYKPFKFLLILFICLNIKSQSIDSQFDEDYLQSLPEEIREDILKESKKAQEESKDSLKARPSSELLKLDIVKNWEEFQRKKEEQSERYGINLFRTMQSSFMPINEPNFGNNYIIDYGDTFEIEIFSGSDSDTYSADVRRDGSIILDGIGPLTVAGLNFDQAVEMIQGKYETSFIGQNISVYLDKIRDIKVLITGNVEFPGIYTLSGNSNVLQVINMAGGIKENGTLRDVQIKRSGKKIKQIDLYEALILGDIADVEALQSGDTVYVPPAKNLVRAGSGFNNEAVFELKDDETLSDLIKFSGGINNNVKRFEYTLIRQSEEEPKIITIDESQLDTYLVKHLDSLYLPVQEYGYVEITGEVTRPGKYTIYRNDDIYDLLNRAGGYTSDAYPFGAVYLTEKARKLEQDFMDKTYQAIVTYIVQNPQQSQQSNMNLPYLLNEIKNTKPSGRVVSDFDMIRLQDNPKNRLLLNDKDQLHIPKMENNVYVFGDVTNPGAVIFRDRLNVDDYINSAGGLAKTADSDLIIIVSPDGSSSLVSKGISLFGIKSSNDIYPGSLIFVPKDVGKSTGLNFYATAAPIFSSLALSIASLNSINN